MAVAIIAIASLWWCVIKAPIVPETSTWEVMTWEVKIMTWGEIVWVQTGTVVTWEVIVWEVLTWSFDSWVVAVITGSEGVNIHSGAVADVQELIQERKMQTGDENKLTEEDIGLMEQIIQKIQLLGK